MGLIREGLSGMNSGIGSPETIESIISDATNDAVKYLSDVADKIVEIDDAASRAQNLFQKAEDRADDFAIKLSEANEEIGELKDQIELLEGKCSGLRTKLDRWIMKA